MVTILKFTYGLCKCSKVSKQKYLSIQKTTSILWYRNCRGKERSFPCVLCYVCGRIFHHFLREFSLQSFLHQVAYTVTLRAVIMANMWLQSSLRTQMTNSDLNYLWELTSEHPVEQNSAHLFTSFAQLTPLSTYNHCP